MVDELWLTLITMPSPRTSRGRSFHSYLLGCAAETIDLVLSSPSVLRSGLRSRALIAENAEIVANLHALVVARD